MTDAGQKVALFLKRTISRNRITAKNRPGHLTGAVWLPYSASVDRDLLTILAQPLEANCAAVSGEQGVVSALAHVHTGVDVGAALTHQDVAGLDELTVGTLGAKALGLGITARSWWSLPPFLWAKN